MSESVVSVTFDNLGEAAQLELGMWPPDVPEGQHFSVVDVLPRLLDLLAAHKLDATFFVEGLNARMYPQALRTIVDAGHEVAVHAWRHEEWAALDAATEAALLTRATDAMRSIGIEPSGFRPPGGGLTERTLALLGEHGYRHVSPAGERAGVLDGLAVLPFRWPLVDAYSYLPTFAGLRERYDGTPDPRTPEQMRDAMIAALENLSYEEGCHIALLFHPFSAAFTGDAGWEALDTVLGEIVRLAGTGALTAMRMDAAATRMLALPEELNGPPLLDDATWMTR
ncbi:MAG TPA: polysaccharide deacetylase family protein [Solirubrobacteraceae bacterium]|nr:polysaccharide deacetylase family protein [Solirubrobacteraceae bacterium]